MKNKKIGIVMGFLFLITASLVSCGKAKTTEFELNKQILIDTYDNVTISLTVNEINVNLKTENPQIEIVRTLNWEIPKGKSINTRELSDISTHTIALTGNGPRDEYVNEFKTTTLKSSEISSKDTVYESGSYLFEDTFYLSNITLDSEYTLDKSNISLLLELENSKIDIGLTLPKE